MPSTSRGMYSCLIVTALAAGLYLNSIEGGFVFDDHEAIENNINIRSDTPLSHVFTDDFWGLPLTHNESHKSYRPLTTLSFRLNFFLHGLWTPGFHAVNIAVHSAVCVLYHCMLRELGVGRTVNIVASVLFATHPIHTEAVSNIVGRTEPLSTIFFILSFLCYSNSLLYSSKSCRLSVSEGTISSRRPTSYSLPWISLSVSLSLVSMLCKEQGVTVLGVCLAYDILVACGLDVIEGIYCLKLIGQWLWYKSLGCRGESSHLNHRSPWTLPLWLYLLLQRLLLLTISCFVILVFRFYINGKTAPLFVESDNPASYSTHLLTRSLTYSYLLVLNLWLLVCPSGLCFDWSMGSVPLVEDIADPRNIATCALYVGLLLLVITTSGFWTNFLSTSKPPTNISAGSSIQRLLGYYSDDPGSHSLHQHTSLASDNKNSTYKVTKKPGLKECHGSEPADPNALGKRGSCLILFTIALTVLPFLPASNLLFPVGFVLAERVLYLPSLGICLLVAMGAGKIKSRCGRGKCLVNVLLLLVVVGFSVKTFVRSAEWNSSESLGKAAIPVNPGNAKVFMTLGNVYAQQGLRKCELLYREALRLRPNYTSAWTNLGLVLLNTDRAEEAERCYLKALSIKHDHINANINMGHLCRLQQRWSEAKSHYETALNRRPNNALIRYYVGVVLENIGGAENHQSAEQEYRYCLNLYPAHVESHVALASLLATVTSTGYRLNSGYTKRQRLDQAVYYYQKALSLKPQQVEVYYELGKIIAWKGNYHEAKMEFLTALTYDPEHSKAHFELGKTYIKLDDKNEAIQEFQSALKIDPHLNAAHQKLEELT